MICRIIKICAVLFTIPTFVHAGWQVAKPDTTIPNEPFFQARPATVVVKDKPVPVSAYGAQVFPNKMASLGKPAEVYAISVSGSLKENIERIMDRYHWKVVWKAPYDYNFDGRVTGSSLPNVMEKLLKPFPLKAVLYMSNRTMTIEARNV